MKLDIIASKGKPRTYSSGDEFLKAVVKYIDICETVWKQYPNIAGFCAYEGICRDTFYMQKEYYPDTYKKAQDILENIAINSRNASDTMKIFYLKNKFQYRNIIYDHIETEKPEEYDFSELTDEELYTLTSLFDKVK